MAVAAHRLPLWMCIVIHPFLSRGSMPGNSVVEPGNSIVQSDVCSNILTFSRANSSFHIPSSPAKLLSCVLDVHPSQTRCPHLLIPNSLCPLGTEFARLGRERGLRIVDVRGSSHLNLSEASARVILSQINITSVAVLCPTNVNLSSLFQDAPRVFSAVGGAADVHIEFPPIWGTVRGEKTELIETNWFFECACGLALSPPVNGDSRFALANSMAHRVYQVVTGLHSSGHADFRNERTYTSTELFRSMESVCAPDRSSPALGEIEEMLKNAQPYPPGSFRELTVSFVTILTSNARFTSRFERNLEVIAFYLQSFRDLPFEIVVCYGNMSVNDSSFDSVISVPPMLRPKVRVIRLPYGFGAEFHPPVFPEYLARNVGIRRSRGEFIISMSSDIIPHFSVFEAILHRQFTHYSLFRAPRNAVPFLTAPDLYQQVMAIPRSFSQELVDRMSIAGVMFGACGDFQGCHFTMWSLTRGYVENSCTFHVDARFCADLVWSHVTALFRKTFACEFHLRHVPSSDHGCHFMRVFSRRRTRRGGFILAEGGYHLRPTWGYRGNLSFPPVTF
jgi:hypothetical protein